MRPGAIADPPRAPLPPPRTPHETPVHQFPQRQRRGTHHVHPRTRARVVGAARGARRSAGRQPAAARSEGDPRSPRLRPDLSQRPAPAARPQARLRTLAGVPRGTSLRYRARERVGGSPPRDRGPERPAAPPPGRADEAQHQTDARPATRVACTRWNRQGDRGVRIRAPPTEPHPVSPLPTGNRLQRRRHRVLFTCRTSRPRGCATALDRQQRRHGGLQGMDRPGRGAGVADAGRARPHPGRHCRPPAVGGPAGDAGAIRAAGPLPFPRPAGRRPSDDRPPGCRLRVVP